MSEFKHRKGFREDAQILAEAYENIYDNREQLDEVAPLVAGLARGAIAGIAGKQIGKKMSDAVVVGDIGEDEHDASSDEELSDDYTNPNYRGDPHDFQPGEIIEVGPWGPNDEADHLEVVLQVNDDGVVNTVPITDDAYGVQYGGRGGADISLIRPQSELEPDSQEQFTPMEFPSDEEYQNHE